MAKKKARHQKTAVEMEFNDFVSWATSEILFGIAEGKKLRDIVYTIVDHAARNEHFGRYNEEPE